MPSHRSFLASLPGSDTARTQQHLLLNLHKQPFASSFSPPLLLRFFWGWCRTFFKNIKNRPRRRVCHLSFYFRFESMREFRKLLFWLASLYIILTNQRVVLKRAITPCTRQPTKWRPPRKDRDRISAFRDQFGDQMHKRDYLISEFQSACRVT